MSEAYAHDTALVTEGSTSYDRFIDGAIALSIVTFATTLLALVELVPLGTAGSALGSYFLTLFAAVSGGVGLTAGASWANVVTVTSQRVRGVAGGLLVTTGLLTAVAYLTAVTLATLLGFVLISQALIIGAAGVSSRLDIIDTEPDASAGLLAGGAFAVIGTAIGGALGGTVVGFDSIAWLVFPAVVGAGLAVLTIVPREDLGSTIPVGLVVGTLGVVVATAAIGIGWQWNPETLDGGFTGGVVIPLFAAFGALISAWAAAKCRAGFGAPGREYGAFLIINLNALLMVVTMVSIVLFVLTRGATYATRGLTTSALTLLVLLVPLLALATEFARSRVGGGEWNRTVRLVTQIAPLAILGAVAAVITTVLITANPIEYGFNYQILQNRNLIPRETAITITPNPEVGAVILMLVASIMWIALFRNYGSLRNVGAAFPRAESVRQVVPVAVAGMAVLIGGVLLVGPTPAGIPLGSVVGVGVVTAGTLAAVGLAALPVAGVATSSGSIADRTQASAPLFTLGVFGGLAVLTAALLLQPVTGHTPGIAGVDLVAVGALFATLACGLAAGVSAYARRTTAETLQNRLLGEETILGLTGAAGFIALLGLHVLATGSGFTVLGVSVTTEGTLSWPMILQPYIPLGAEPGGIMPAVVGTVWLVIGATLFAVPLGIGAAVFLTEYAEQGRLTAVVEIATNALWSTPSIVFGLFGAAFIIPRLGGNESLLAGMLVLGFMLLPLVLITSRESIKAVPDEYRDASAALGVSQWETIKSVVLPAAMPGVITGGILGIGRIAGETAPLILVLGSTLNATESVNVLQGFQFVAEPPFIINDQLLAASASLPTQVWAVIAAGVSGSPQMGWASAAILLSVVLTFYAIGITARTYFRRKLSYE